VKPILFLDFDRTLFNTGLFYEWLGEDEPERVACLLSGNIPSPDFSAMLYSDARDFLEQMKDGYSVVLLTYSTRTTLQELKIRESGVLPFLDEVIITQKEKGSAMREYLDKAGSASAEDRKCVFLDDELMNIHHVKATTPNVFCVQINRGDLGDSLLPVDVPGAIIPDAVVSDLSEFARLLSAPRP